MCSVAQFLVKKKKKIPIKKLVVKTVIVHFFEIEIKYDFIGKFLAENEGNIGFLRKQ